MEEIFEGIDDEDIDIQDLKLTSEEQERTKKDLQPLHFNVNSLSPPKRNHRIVDLHKVYPAAVTPAISDGAGSASSSFKDPSIPTLKQSHDQDSSTSRSHESHFGSDPTDTSARRPSYHMRSKSSSAEGAGHRDAGDTAMSPEARDFHSRLAFSDRHFSNIDTSFSSPSAAATAAAASLSSLSISPSSASPRAGSLSLLDRRRSIGNGRTRPTSLSPGTSPTFSQFHHHHRRQKSNGITGNESPAFGASSPPNLPLHAHLEQARTDDVLSRYSASPRMHAALEPDPPADADEPWVDLPAAAGPITSAIPSSPSTSGHMYEYSDPSHRLPPNASPIFGTRDLPISLTVDPNATTRDDVNGEYPAERTSPSSGPSSISPTHSLLLGQRSGSASSEGSQSPIASDTLRRLGGGQPLTRFRSPTSGEFGYALTRHRSHSPSGSRSSVSQPRAASMHRRSPSLGANGVRSPILDPIAATARAGASPTSPHSPIWLELSSRSPSTGTPAFSPGRASPVLSQSPSSPRATREQKGSPLSPAQRVLFPPVPHHDLALPPRSGWDLSDDADISPVEEDLLERHGAETTIDSEATEKEDTSPPVSPSSPAMGTIPLPRLQQGDESRSPEWGARLDFNRSPSIEIETLSPEEQHESDPAHDDAFQIDMDEEGLTSLERIFLFAKSEHADHRDTVSSMLPIWIEGVEICEAVDYIFPLLQGLAQDEDFVKETFANSLDGLMWFFYSRCPLAELSSPHSLWHISQVHEDEGHTPNETDEHIIKARTRNETSGGGPGHSSKIGLDTRPLESAGTIFETTGSTPTSGTTLVESVADDAKQNESGSDVEMADRPLLPASAFFNLLAPLLMDEVSTTSAVAQEALVRFFMRLNNIEQIAPPESDIEIMKERERALDGNEKRSHTHGNYYMPLQAREILSDALLRDIVLALFSLEDNHAGYNSLWTRKSTDDSLPPTDTDASSKFSHFFDDPIASTSPPTDYEPDVQQAVFVGLTMVSLLADSRALRSEDWETKVLPIVLECVHNGSVVVKRQSVEVLGALSKVVSSEAVTTLIAPCIRELASEEASVTRRAVATILSDVVAKIQPRDVQVSYAIELACKLARDAVPPVRQAFLEVSGPLIYNFEGDVPEELLQLFLGDYQSHPAPSSDQSDEETGHDAFAPLVPAFAMSNDSAQAAPRTIETWNVADYPERAIITAYNLPGVCLSVGARGWHKLRKLHASLVTESTLTQPKYLAASSIHDVASIIGPEAATEDLLPLYKLLIEDAEPEIATRAFERLSEFAGALIDDTAQDMADILCNAWHVQGVQDWHLREILVEALMSLVPRLISSVRCDGLLEVVEQALLDRVAAVRFLGAKATRAVLENSQHGSVPYEVCRSHLLDLAYAPNHKSRALFCTCLQEMLEHSIALDDAIVEVLVKCANDTVVDTRMLAARVLAIAVPTTGLISDSSRQELESIVKRLKKDKSPSVREELRSIDMESFGPIEEDGSRKEKGNWSPDSSEDEDDHSPTSTTPLHHNLQSDSSISNEASTDSAEPQYNDHTPKSGEDRDCDSDDSDSRSETLDLDCSTIYEIDLDELASSTISLDQLTTPVPAYKIDNDIDTHLSAKPMNLFGSLISSTPPNDAIQRTGVRAPSPYSAVTKPASMSPEPWQLAMHDEDQYVAIDVTGKA